MYVISHQAVLHAASVDNISSNDDQDRFPTRASPLVLCQLRVHGRALAQSRPLDGDGALADPEVVVVYGGRDDGGWAAAIHMFAVVLQTNLDVHVVSPGHRQARDIELGHSAE